jgi:hypothetical protein
MEKDRYTRITLRIPSDLYGKLVYEADVTSKSTNAEIVARLNDSFLTDDPSGRLRELELTVEHNEIIVTALTNELERCRQVISTQEQLIAMLGVHLRITAERVPTSDDQTSNSLMAVMKNFGNAIAHNDLKSAAIPMMELLKLGTDLGIFNEDGTPGPNHPNARNKP